MIPYFELQNLELGPITIHVWGFMVALGVLAATSASATIARARKLDPKIIWDTLPWVLVGAIIGARIFHVLLYEPGYYLTYPLQIIAIWQGGLSIAGGLIGGLLVGIWYLKKRKVDVWRYADVAVFGLPLGLFIGRIGCFLTHLHPGTPTDFFLGVMYPDGVIRHDHGLYLSLNGLILFLVFLIMLRKRVQNGMFIVVYLVWYGLVRFLLDFFRAYEEAIVDTRYLGLTPAQYFSVLMVLVGIMLFIRLRKRHGRSS